jgi:hypothetical protein
MAWSIERARLATDLFFALVATESSVSRTPSCAASAIARSSAVIPASL